VSNEEARFGGVEFGRPQSWRQRIVYFVLHRLAQIVFRLYFRTWSRGRERFPMKGPVIICPAGHRSNLDTPLVGSYTHRQLRYMAKDSLFTSPFWTRFIVALGGFPVHRDRLDRKALGYATMCLERGEALVVFPEGERKQGPRVQPLLEGAVWLSVRTGAPILPLGVGGSEQAMPKGTVIPRPRAIRFITGDLVWPPEPNERGRVSREAITKATADLRETLQDLFDEAQVWAGSPNER
jgi:1-acyl-sn-glycerol-3-phosphate acyltransferase